MRTLYVILGVVTVCLIASITAITINGSTVPDGLYISLSGVIGILGGAVTQSKQAK